MARILASCIHIFLLFVITSNASAQSHEVVDCNFMRSGVVKNLQELPFALRSSLLKIIPDITDNPTRFQDTDLFNGPSKSLHLFIGAKQDGRDWFVWYRKGGLTSSHTIMFDDTSPDKDLTIFRSLSTAHLVGRPCEAVEALKHGVLSSKEGDY